MSRPSLLHSQQFPENVHGSSCQAATTVRASCNHSEGTQLSPQCTPSRSQQCLWLLVRLHKPQKAQHTAAHNMMAAAAKKGTSLLLDPCCVLRCCLPMQKKHNPPCKTSAAACAHAAPSRELTQHTATLPLHSAVHTNSVPGHPSLAVSDNAQTMAAPVHSFRTLSLLTALGPLLLLLVLKMLLPATTALPTCPLLSFTACIHPMDPTRFRAVTVLCPAAQPLSPSLHPAAAARVRL